MKAFIDEHREIYGVEPICRVLPIAPSTYYEHAARKADPDPESGPRAPGCRTVPRDPPGLRGQLRRLWRPQGLAPDAARGDRGRPLHGRPSDAADGPPRGGARQEHPDDRQRRRSTMPA